MNVLAENLISVGPGAIAGHGLSMYRKRFTYRTGDLPVSVTLDSQGLALPLYERLSIRQQEMVVQRLREAVRGQRTHDDG